jgi:hypothetical protein
MEASENRGPPRGGRGATDLHRIDPDRVAETLRSPSHAGGYARLELMLNSILPRLAGEPPSGHAGYGRSRSF